MSEQDLREELLSDALGAWMEHSVDEPFADSTNQFMVWLTREEFQLCYALSFALQLDGVVSPHLDMGQAFRATISVLVHENGYEFEGLTMDEDLKLWPVESRALEPQNAHWMGMIFAGKPPDLEAHLVEAIAMARQKDALASHLSYLEAALAKVRGDMTIMSGMQPEPEDRQAIRDMLRIPSGGMWN